MYKAIILPFVCMRITRGTTLREKHRLCVFETGEARRTLGRQMEAITGEWRELYNDSPHDLC
jgi:hypothetical protein